MSKKTTQRWTYSGPRDALDIKLPSGRWLRVERGQTVDVLPNEARALKPLPGWEQESN